MAKPIPIHVIIRQMRLMSPFRKACHLKGKIASEPLRSGRRRDLQAILEDVVNRQLRKESKAA